MIDFTNVFQGLVRSMQSSLKKKAGWFTLYTLLISPLLNHNALAGRNPLSNQMPVGVTDVYTVDEDGQLTGNVLTNDYDPDGEIVMIDFHKKPLPLGPPPQMKIAREEVIEQLERGGFRLAREHTFLPYQYFLVFVPK